MGVVYTTEQIRNNEIPDQENFDQAYELLQSRLSADPAIVAALFFGSIIRKDANRRSDIDCMVIFDKKQESAANASMRVLSDRCEKLFVSINFVPCDTETASTKMHFFGESFIEHLERSREAGGSIKGDVLSHIEPSVEREEEVSSYVRSKLYNLQEAYTKSNTFDENQRAAFLKKTLEAPMHVARKTLAYYGPLQDDSKKGVQAQYAKTMSQELSRQLDELIELDAWYSVELEAQLEEFDEERYKTCLDRLEESVPLVVEFIRGNALILDAENQK